MAVTELRPRNLFIESIGKVTLRKLLNRLFWVHHDQRAFRPGHDHDGNNEHHIIEKSGQGPDEYDT